MNSPTSREDEVLLAGLIGYFGLLGAATLADPGLGLNLFLGSVYLLAAWIILGGLARLIRRLLRRE